MNELYHRTVVTLFLTSSLISCQSRSTPSDPKIHFGQKVEGNDKYPWMVSFLENGDDHRCGGTLIAPSFVLTAEHCFAERDGEFSPTYEEYIRDVRVKIGATSLASEDGEIRKVKAVIPAPYQLGALGDIVLVELDQPSTRSPLPINMDPQAIGADTLLEMLGWGRTEHEHEPKDLYYAQTKLLRGQQCPIRGDDLICTQSDTSSFCSGDSGGPLFAILNGKQILVGIVSRQEFGCGPGNVNAFTSVARYAPWIQQKVPMANH